MKYFIACFCFLLPFCTYGQDRILFLNGKERVVGKVFGMQNKEIIFSEKGDSSRKSMSVNRVFSITGSGGQENVIYRQDTAVEYYLTIDQMRMYIAGEQEAIRNYKTPVPLVTGAAFGVAGGLVIPFFATLSLIPPAAGALIGYNLTPDVSRQGITDRKYLESPDFIAGYQQKAKSKNLKNACIGGGAGLLATFTVLLLKGAIK